MVKKYLRERLSWILLFICLQLLVLFVSYIDPEIPLHSLLYIVYLSAVIFVIFLVLRYHIETKFYKSLAEWEPHLDLSNLAVASSPFEEVISENLLHQTKRLKGEAEYNRVLLEEEKDDMLAWVHEVKTPLTAMHLMIERLDDEIIKTQLTYEWLRIHLLLDQQLHQKRIVFIENDLYVELVQLKPLISQEIRTLRSWCMQKGIGFDLDLQVTEVLSDAKWLAFIVRQLITNAVKYSEAADVYVRSYSQDDGAILEVQDSGRGIDQRDLHRIFDKGFTSTLNHHEHMATGMGLYLSKKAADSLMIQIDVQSKPGQGTTMRLIFPKRNDFVLIRES